MGLKADESSLQSLDGVEDDWCVWSTEREGTVVGEDTRAGTPRVTWKELRLYPQCTGRVLKGF